LCCYRTVKTIGTIKKLLYILSSFYFMIKKKEKRSREERKKLKIAYFIVFTVLPSPK